MKRIAAIVVLAFACGCDRGSQAVRPELADNTRGVAGVSSTREAAVAAAAWMRYRCDSGGMVEAAYAADQSALVRYRDRERTMKVAISASGARYVGDGFEWWTRGSGKGARGVLYVHRPDGTTGEALETCTQGE